MLLVVERAARYVRLPRMPEARLEQAPENPGATTCNPAELSKTAVADWVAAVAKAWPVPTLSLGKPGIVIVIASLHVDQASRAHRIM